MTNQVKRRKLTIKVDFPSVSFAGDDVVSHQVGFAASEVIPSFLFLGADTDAYDVVGLMDHHIGYVLNVAKECDPMRLLSHSDIVVMSIPLNDFTDEDIKCHFKEACDFIEHARKTGARILVNCRKGISRSSTIVMAYIMMYYQCTREKAMQFVRSKRKAVSPNFGFDLALQEWENELQEQFPLLPLTPNSCHVMIETPTHHSESWENEHSKTLGSSIFLVTLSSSHDTTSRS